MNVSRGRLKIVLLASTLLVAALVVCGISFAGYKSDSNVQCYPAYSYAAGAMGTARNSQDSSQYIGCSLQGYAGSSPTSLYCFAQNSAGTYCGCGSSDPHLIAVAQSMTSDPYLYFGWDANSTCSWLRVEEDSYYPSKQP